MEYTASEYITSFLVLGGIIAFFVVKAHDNKARGGGRPISTAGKRTESGQLLCPTCGGTQFKAKRSAGAKAALIPTVGIGALLAPKSRVKCETCGTEFLRG